MDKVFGLICATKVVEYFNLPVNNLAVILQGFEALYNNIAASNYTLPNYSLFSSFNQTSLISNTHSIFKYANSGYSSISSYVLILPVFLVIYILSKYKIHDYLFERVYFVRIKSYININILHNYSSTIDNHPNMRTLINYLITKKSFINGYTNKCYYKNKYTAILAKTDAISKESLLCYTNIKIPCPWKRYYFNDIYTGVSGYIVWKEVDTTITITNVASRVSEKTGLPISTSSQSDITTQIPELYLSINMDVDDFLARISEQKLFCVNKLYFVHIKPIVQIRVINEVRYTGDFVSYCRDNICEEMKKKWIDTFFHPLKSEIWSKLYAIHFDPEKLTSNGQYPQASYCLYGPPGTGKSSIVYRMAQALGRGIISINLLEIKTTFELREIFNGTLLSTGTKSITSDPKSCIFVFDEIDKSILALNARNKLKKKIENHCINNLDYVLNKEEEEEEGGAEEQKDNQEEQETKSEKHNKVKAQFNKYMNDLSGSNELTIDSLLDIIQGPCANDGLIIFATTNKYHELQTICPRLFRDGRFKPVYFGYPTKSILNEITKFYYNKSMDKIRIPNEIRIPLSRITIRAVDLIAQYPDNPQKQFDVFVSKLLDDIENYSLINEFKDFDEESSCTISSQSD